MGKKLMSVPLSGFVCSIKYISMIFLFDATLKIIRRDKDGLLTLLVPESISNQCVVSLLRTRLIQYINLIIY